MNELNAQDSTRPITQSTAPRSAGAAADRRTESGDGGNRLPASGEALPLAASANDPQRVNEAVVELNDYVQQVDRNLRFTFDNDLGRSIVSVVDGETDQVIRQIPNDVAIRLARNLKTALEEQVQPATASGAAAASAGALGIIDTTV